MDTLADLADHLCCQLEFCSLVLLKQAYAGARGWRTKRRITERALGLFVQRRLGRWLGAFVASLEENYAPEPYRALGRLLNVAVEAECARLRVRPERVDARLSNDEMQAECFTCPRASAAEEPFRSRA